MSENYTNFTPLKIVILGNTYLNKMESLRVEREKDRKRDEKQERNEVVEILSNQK